jgi:hypothetical protein
MHHLFLSERATAQACCMNANAVKLGKVAVVRTHACSAGLLLSFAAQPFAAVTKACINISYGIT